MLEIKVILIDKIADLGDETEGGQRQSLSASCDFSMQPRVGSVERSAPDPHDGQQHFGGDIYLMADVDGAPERAVHGIEADTLDAIEGDRVRFENTGNPLFAWQAWASWRTLNRKHARERVIPLPMPDGWGSAWIVRRPGS
jgi:hypothetical protein